MAAESVSTIAPNKNDFSARMLKHEVNGVRELCSGPQDAAIQRTQYIHALAALLNSYYVDRREAQLESINSQLLEGVCSAICLLSAEAEFFILETELGHTR